MCAGIVYFQSLLWKRQRTETQVETTFADISHKLSSFVPGRTFTEGSDKKARPRYARLFHR